MAYGSRDKARRLSTWHDLIARFFPPGHFRQPFIREGDRAIRQTRKGGAELQQPWRPVIEFLKCDAGRVVRECAMELCVRV
jgi:hypothetical protein